MTILGSIALAVAFKAYLEIPAFKWLVDRFAIVLVVVCVLAGVYMEATMDG